ncbi:hypothetical protein GCK72_002743 [Caenorhabditis remanei]|uniref:Uncharacterized protein n=1 Tax=Caenorhabditis remanei TaxID=31234 RepID=A0A6A5HT61_CAERE|nr:hypothetical protein GCK72_002743 [Caenorhabditis remanei]KAF1770919.1 hypothetical protein GCK72_002743 [Caenorhabditis remanei]
MMIQVIINWLFDNKSVLFGALLPILLSPVVGFDCAGKNKIGKNKNMKKKKQEETESENSKKKKKKRSKEDTSGDSVEESAPMKKSVMYMYLIEKGHEGVKAEIRELLFTGVFSQHV